MTVNLVTVKQCFIEKLKATTTVTTLIGNTVEIRDYEWHGTRFTYPNVRVQIESFKRSTPGIECRLFNVIAHIVVFADDATSLVADNIAAAIWEALDTKTVGNTQVRLIGIKAVHMGAIRQVEGGVWQSEVQIESQASPA